MIVSHEHRFIFLKTRKTAGTSIEIALSAVCGDRDVLTPLLPHDDEVARRARSGRGAQHHAVPLRQYGPKDWARLVVRRRRRQAYNHMPAPEVRRLVGGQVWDQYVKFAVSRNPFDVAVSMYHWSGSAGAMTFSEFLRSPGFALASRNFEIFALDGGVAADRVLAYDRLADEMLALSRELSLPTLDLPRAKTTVRAGAEERQALFSADDIELVRQRCGREIELMGYTFDA